MRTEHLTALSLKYLVVIGLILIVVGEAVNLANGWNGLLWFGVLFLIVSPLNAIIVTAASLYANKERKWVTVALLLIVVSAIGMAVSYFC